MKGRNVLVLNQATMLEAMQLWLDHTYKKAPKANHLKQVIESGAPVFHLDVVEPEAEKTDV